MITTYQQDTTHKVASKTSVCHITPCGGMWSVNYQWKSWEKRLHSLNFHLSQLDYPGHGNRAEQLDQKAIDDYVADKIWQIRTHGEPTVVVGHSLGGPIAIRASMELLSDPATRHLIKGIFIVAHSPFKRFQLPFRTQMRMLKYWKAMHSGDSFTLNEDDSAFIRDGSNVPLWRESGKVLAEMALGFEVPRLRHLESMGCPSILVIPKHDQVVPVDIAYDIADYHGTSTITLNGGHFAHCNQNHQTPILDLLIKRVHAWCS